VFGHDDFLTRSIRNAGEPTAATASATAAGRSDYRSGPDSRLSYGHG